MTQKNINNLKKTTEQWQPQKNWDIFCFIKINITHAHYILNKIYVLLLVSMLHYYYKQLPFCHF